MVFFGTLVFFLITNVQLRRKLIISFGSRETRLRIMRIWNDIEDNLAEYVGLVTMINIALGLVTMAMLYLIGFPNPVTFGLLTIGLNYIPYIGPAIVALVLLSVGLVAMPTLFRRRSRRRCSSRSPPSRGISLRRASSAGGSR